LPKVLDGLKGAQVAGKRVSMRLEKQAPAKGLGNKDARDMVIEKAVTRRQGDAHEPIQKAQGVCVEGEGRRQAWWPTLGKGREDLVEGGVSLLVGKEDGRGKGEGGGEGGRIQRGRHGGGRRRGRRDRGGGVEGVAGSSSCVGEGSRR
jgi:hypothetical protein